jgi:hypothetical protein
MIPTPTTFTPPDPNFLAIARLFLENYSILAEEDRKLYRGLLWMLASPPVIMAQDGGLEFLERKAPDVQT